DDVSDVERRPLALGTLLLRLRALRLGFVCGSSLRRRRSVGRLPLGLPGRGGGSLLLATAPPALLRGALGGGRALRGPGGLRLPVPTLVVAPVCVGGVVVRCCCRLPASVRGRGGL